MNLKEYWEKRANASLKSVGQRTYSEEFNKFDIEMLFDTLLREFGRFPQNKQVLDVGCGIGRILKFHANFSNNIFGVDFSKNMLNICKNNVSSAKLVNGDACNLPFKDECFDVVSAFVVLQHIIDDKKRQTAISEMIRVIKPNGMIIINEEILKSFEVRKKICKLFGHDFKEQEHIRHWDEEDIYLLLKNNNIIIKQLIKSRELSLLHYVRFVFFIIFQGTYILIRYRRKPSEQYTSSNISELIDRILLNKVISNSIKRLSRLMLFNKCDQVLIIGEKA